MQVRENRTVWYTNSMRLLKLLTLAGALALAGCQNKTASNPYRAMQLTSPAFGHNQSIPPAYTCDADDVNPPLETSGVPQAAQSLVLIVDDPDAPRGDWVHWTIWNIRPDVKEIGENSVPAGGVEGLTDFGRTGWGGPCPPSGEHRYQFKLYALDTTLNLDQSAKKADVERAMQNHVLDQTVLVGLYRRR